MQTHETLHPWYPLGISLISILSHDFRWLYTCMPTVSHISPPSVMESCDLQALQPAPGPGVQVKGLQVPFTRPYPSLPDAESPSCSFQWDKPGNIMWNIRFSLISFASGTQTWPLKIRYTWGFSLLGQSTQLNGRFSSKPRLIFRRVYLLHNTSLKY